MEHNVVGLTANVQSILNNAGQKYVVKADRIAAYQAIVSNNPRVASIPVSRAQAALTGRVPSDLTALIRGAEGYASLKRNWDWPRGVLALIVAQGGGQDARDYSAVR